MASAFATANPGHSLAFAAATRELAVQPVARVGLVQAGEANMQIACKQAECMPGEPSAASPRSSPVGVGDVVVLEPGEAASFDAPLDLLVFALPVTPDRSVPRAIRPDWDPRITDTPGGCATDGKAYRRIQPSAPNSMTYWNVVAERLATPGVEHLATTDRGIVMPEWADPTGSGNYALDYVEFFITP